MDIPTAVFVSEALITRHEMTNDRNSGHKDARLENYIIDYKKVLNALSLREKHGDFYHEMAKASNEKGCYSSGEPQDTMRKSFAAQHKRLEQISSGYSEQNTRCFEYLNNNITIRMQNLELANAVYKIEQQQVLKLGKYKDNEVEK